MSMFGSKIPAALSLPQGFNNPAPPKPKFFGQGGTGRAILGSIGDALLQSNNMGPIYAPAMAEQRAMQMAEQNYQRQMRDSLALYEAKARIAAQNQPDPFAKALQFNSLPEEQKRAVANYYDVVNPRMVNGYIPGVGFVQQPIAREVPLSDEEILRMEQGEAGGNASGGFQY